jgi:hypothetical protein
VSEELLNQEYTQLVGEWEQAEAVRQRLVDRLRALDRPLMSNDAIWEEWDRADETAGSARDAVRSFLAANEHAERPSRVLSASHR